MKQTSPPPCKKKLMPLRLKKYMQKHYPEESKIVVEDKTPYDKLRIRGDPFLTLVSRAADKIYGVYFICCIGNYKEIVAEQMSTLHRSGLFRKADTIFCFICLYDEEILSILEPYLPKLRIISTSENLYERFALDHFREHIPSTGPYSLFYFHTKGVSRDVDTIFHQQRKNLDYFILERHEVCLFWLDKNYDAVGTALSLYPTMHFSGNFWWAKSSHLDRLPPTVVTDGYLAPEMYVCSFPGGKYISVCQTTNTQSITDFMGLTNTDILKQSTCVPILNRACRTMTF